MSSEFDYQKKRNAGLRFAILGSAVVLFIFVALLLFLNRGQWRDEGKTLVVYCAAGIRKPVEDAADEYRRAYGVGVRLEYGSSGELEGKMELARQGGKPCDLYIPADVSFVSRARGKGLVREALPLARFKLVLGVKPGNPRGLRSLADLLKDDVGYVLCDEAAGAGKKTRDVLAAAGRYKEVLLRARATKARVTEAANDVQTSAHVDAAIVWDTTAKLFGLDAVEIPELRGGESTISVAISSRCAEPAVAFRLARFLSAPDRGQPYFEKYHFRRFDGDRWTESPEILLFCGGVNRLAVSKTIEDFEKREGCRVKAVFGGCGSLVSAIESGQGAQPDLFLTCESSYLDMVEERFGDARDVSSTRMVLVVRKNAEGKSTKKIARLVDLARADVELGIADPRETALGLLSKKLLERVGVWDQVATKLVTAPSAHELILQMEGHEKHDAIIAYEANCQNLSKDLMILPIPDDEALAVQNIAVGNASRFPFLTTRLLEAILSDESATRFKSSGFSWLAEKTGAP